MYRKDISHSWFKHNTVLDGLSYGIACLFDSFVPSQSMNEGTASIGALILIPLYSNSPNQHVSWDDHVSNHCNVSIVFCPR